MFFDDHHLSAEGAARLSGAILSAVKVEVLHGR